MEKLDNILGVNFKKMTKNLLLNLIAAIIVSAVLQLIVYPSIARVFDKTMYGVVLTVMGIANTIGISFGNSLNNTKLVQNGKYVSNDVDGDFNIILYLANVISTIVIMIVGIILFDFSTTILILIISFVFLMVLRSYLLVIYRINLDFKSYLINNILMAVGYLIGIVFVNLYGLWPIPFILAELISVIYTISKTRYNLSKISITILFNDTLKKYLIILLTSFSTNIMIYLDRLLLYPLLGSESVSVYSVSVFFGKIVGIAITPLASVVLSYYSSENFKMTRKKFWIVNLILVVVFIVSIPAIYFLAPYSTRVIYPTIYEYAEKYILYGNIAVVISILPRLIQPAILKFCPTYWQIIKELLFGLIYIFVAILLTPKYGIFAIIIAITISSIVKIIILLIVGDYYIKRMEKIYG